MSFENRPGLRRFARWTAAALALTGFCHVAEPGENVFLMGVPDYDWHLGCFGTATGNLMGYWDRHGFPDFYRGPTGGGLAPLNSFGGNSGIRSLWATAAGLDGRPRNQPGHQDDYWVYYESVDPDPYRVEGRAEHSPDCLGDFIGLNQRKWRQLGDECEGNIDGYSFNFFARDGERRENFLPRDETGSSIPDIQSGLRAWTEFRGEQADAFSQLTDFNPTVPSGRGFTFGDLKAEIDAGYPVLLFMQPFEELSRRVAGLPGLNPLIHAMLAYGYVVTDLGENYVRYRTSWASGDNQFSAWNDANWTPNGELDLPLRGVIGYHPRPRLVEVSRTTAGLFLRWHGPLSELHDQESGIDTVVHAYVVEETSSLESPHWQAVAGPISGLEVRLSPCCDQTAFYRLRLAGPG